jgi:hypothetical protein
MNALDVNTITFGKYKDLTLQHLLKDRKYCEWLTKQEWFPKQYEYLFNRVTEYKPKMFFLSPEKEDKTLFVDFYRYFYLIPLEDLKIELTDDEKTCYSYYLDLIVTIKNKIIDRTINGCENPYNIKAPTYWLKKFESQSQLSRTKFKDFLSSYELPNIPYIIEDVKKVGGIEYKGARSFLIAKQKSVEQETWWEGILKEKYGEDIGTQFQYQKCIFDFLHINNNVIYECKLNLKDFNEDQHRKYLLTLGTYKIIYLISRDCIINLQDKKIYHTNLNDKYSSYIANIPTMKNPSKFDDLIFNYEIIKIEDILKFL